MHCRGLTLGAGADFHALTGWPCESATTHLFDPPKAILYSLGTTSAMMQVLVLLDFSLLFMYLVCFWARERLNRQVSLALWQQRERTYFCSHRWVTLNSETRESKKNFKRAPKRQWHHRHAFKEGFPSFITSADAMFVHTDLQTHIDFTSEGLPSQTD